MLRSWPTCSEDFAADSLPVSCSCLGNSSKTYPSLISPDLQLSADEGTTGSMQFASFDLGAASPALSCEVLRELVVVLKLPSYSIPLVQTAYFSSLPQWKYHQC